MVQNATRRAELWAARRRSNGSRVQSSRRACRTRDAIGMSSIVNRMSFIAVFVNSGLRTESRPTTARNWISRRNEGHTPRAIPIDPRELSKPFEPDEPDQKVGVEKKCHRAVRRRQTRLCSGPRHSQDHWSAFSAPGTRRSRLYCRASLLFRVFATSSRRSTSR